MPTTIHQSIACTFGLARFEQAQRRVEVASRAGIPVIGDGGIKFSGDVVKGLAAGASLRQLEQIYADFDVQTADDPAIGPIWLLNSTNTGNLLLWGPLTADDTVRGIYAPDACGRF